MKRMQELLLLPEYKTTWYVKSKFTEADSTMKQVEETLGEWASQVIPSVDGLIFIGATGIVVRTIAPFVKSKRTDPAVLVFDEKGQFAIPLLSGHLGGANELALKLSQKLNSIPVLTTATDVNHQFAVDVFAKKNHLWISSMKLAKEVSAGILAGNKQSFGVGIGGKTMGNINLPEVLEKIDCPDGKKATFWIKIEKEPEKTEYLHLVPKNLILGIGCRKGTPVEKIEALVQKVFREKYLFEEGISQVVSIDLKAEEPGLVEFCEKRKLPFTVYSAEKLSQVEGIFSASSFVSQITGVDNVCERSVCLAGGTLLIKKQAQDGVTVACGVKEWSVYFE